MKVFRVTLLLLLLWIPGVLSAAELLPEHVPVFERADRFSPLIGETDCGTTGTGPEFRAFSVLHPLAWYNRCLPVRLADGRRGFAMPEGFVREGEAYFPPPLPALPASGALTALVMLLYLLWKKSRPGASWKEGEGAACIVLLRLVFLLMTLVFWAGVCPSASDDPGYFEITKDLLAGRINAQWRFTLGTGLYYLPFTMLTGAEKFYDIALTVDLFNALVIAPAALAAGFHLLRRMGLSFRAALFAGVFWAVWPWFAFHLEHWDPDFVRPMTMLPPLPDSLYAGGRFYAICIGAGFNAMSDTPGMLVLFLSLLLMTFPCRTPGRLFAAGAAFGLACLFRINYVFLAPLGAWLVLRQWGSAEFRRAWVLLGAGAVGFFSFFLWQLLVNFLQFGSPLTFGYVLHYTDFPELDRPAAGFTLHTLFAGRSLRYLAGVQRPLWAAGLAGMLCAATYRERTALTLLSLPLIFFFFGYSQTYCDARRFILPAYLGMFGGAALFLTAGKKSLPVWIALLAVWVFGANFDGNFVPPAPGWCRILPLTALGVAGVCVLLLFRRKMVREAVFVLLFASFFYLLPPWGTAFLMAVLMIRCAEVPVSALFRRVKKNFSGPEREPRRRPEEKNMQGEAKR